ncbi:MAG: hypothetical protein ACI85I_002735 [Arenicella sp.]|jgi:hypothetical protein
MSTFDTLLERLKQIENIESSHVISKELHFFVEDISTTGTCALKTASSDSEKCFIVKNPNGKKICLLPIDGKDGIIKFEGSYCDAVLFSESHFSFLEMKLNAISSEERAVRKNRNKAVKQLENTIAFFDKKLERDYQTLTLEAFVATPKIYPRADTAWTNLSVEFLEKNGIPLFESSEKEY